MVSASHGKHPRIHIDIIRNDVAGKTMREIFTSLGVLCHQGRKTESDDTGTLFPFSRIGIDFSPNLLSNNSS
jgi:hypothetical protein